MDDDPARSQQQQAAGPSRPGPRRLVIARPFGVPVDVTPAWFLIAGLITVGFAATV